MEASAVFELFVRKLPPGRNFLMAAGLEQLVEYLETLRFDAEELDWVRRSGRFDRPSSITLRRSGSPVMFMRCRRARRSSRTNRSSG